MGKRNRRLKPLARQRRSVAEVLGLQPRKPRLAEIYYAASRSFSQVFGFALSQVWYGSSGMCVNDFVDTLRIRHGKDIELARWRDFVRMHYGAASLALLDTMPCFVRQ